MPEYTQLLDGVTAQKGVEGPFEPYEADAVALRHVLIDATHGYALKFDTDFDAIASMILHSRWFAAVKHFAQFPWFVGSLSDLQNDAEARWNSQNQAPPFNEWETDHRSLVTAIWKARHDGFTADVGRVVENIIASRWYAAVIAENRTPEHVA